MSKEPRVSVREWQGKFQAGAFDGKDLDTQRQAGWRDWHCHVDALAGRLKRIAPVVTGIREPFILDSYAVWFANVRCPGRKAVYDRVWFEPLDHTREGLTFSLNYSSPDEPEKWALYTERFGFQSPEFGCARVQDMIEYISRMAPELEQGVRPSFLDEQAAAARYAQGFDPLYPSGAVCRTGDHSYSFLTWSGQKKTVHVANKLKEVPPDFQKSGTMKVKGLYVYCPEDSGEPALPSPAPKRKQKKEVTR